MELAEIAGVVFADEENTPMLVVLGIEAASQVGVTKATQVGETGNARDRTGDARGLIR